LADTPAAHPWLRVHFLGGFEIWRFDSPVRLETRKSCALFAFLLMNTRPQPRDRLSGLLWDDLPNESARRNLRHALWDLRTRLSSPGGVSPILTDGEMVSFDRQTAYWLDVDTFQCMVDHTLHAQPLRLDDSATLAELQCAADLYNGDFLESLVLKDAPAWDEWVLVERERLRSLALLAYETLAEAYMGTGNVAAAERAAQKLILLDP
jgi:DNA-binding SARP family transcriptional activator